MGSGWDSLETVGRWHAFFEIGGIVALAVLVVMEIAAYKLGHRKETLADALARQQQSEVDSLRRAAESRRLSDEQRGRLVAALRSSAGSRAVIASPLGDAEARAFALQFNATLRDAGISVDIREGVGYDIEPIGLTINFTAVHGKPDPENPRNTLAPASDVPPFAHALQRALRDVGLEAEIMHVPKLEPGVVELRVGHKPRL
jgi:hypothetical protein